MSPRSYFLALLLALFSIGSRAASPIGSIRSGESFFLSGVEMPVAGIRSWPVVEGDEIVTGSALAILSFPDGSRVTLAAGSHVKLEAGGPPTKVRLVTGSLRFQLSSAPKIDIYNRDARQNAPSGTIFTGGRSAPPAPGSGHIRTPAPAPFSRSR